MVDLREKISHYNFADLRNQFIRYIVIKNVIWIALCLLVGAGWRQIFMFSAIRTAFSLLFLVLWLTLDFAKSRSEKYHALPGRNLTDDMRKYKRSYDALLEYFRDADPHRLDVSDFPVIDWHNADGIIFGTVGNRLLCIPSSAEGNVVIYGPPGTGKTSGIAIPSAMVYRGSVLAVDIKGDLYNYVSQHTSRKIVRFCPDSPNALTDSCRFDPFLNIEKMDATEKKLYLESMAMVLIPDDGGADGNYFSSRARKIFQGVTHLLLYQNPNISFPDVIHKILSGNIFDWVTKAQNSPCVEAKELLLSFYGNSEKNVTGAYDALTTALVHFSNPVLDKLLAKDPDSISIETLENGSDIYLQISQAHLDAYAPLFTLILESLSTAFTRRPDTSTAAGANNRPILMLLDEFPQLTFSYNMINSILATLRSKSVNCMLIMQNLSQLEMKYRDGARSIIGNCHYQAILGCNDIHSSKVFSEMIGTRKVLKISTSENNSDLSVNSGRNIQEAREPIFYPEDFGDLKGDLVLYFKGKYCKCKKINCYLN
ncbi:MAG: type IV secretory system conjugative DNA transfer family protein [Lachnospiraceae bacterium]|nr:type IV secretory system conjugative DNA transfer family protein [Lachnospiraceae bacterium]